MPRVIAGLEGLRSLIGQEVGVSEWHAVTQQMIDRFADLTGDHQWIHVDVERAHHESPFKATVAHGFLTMSLLAAMSQEAMEVRGDFKLRVNYGFNRLRFVSPVPAGSRVRAHFTAASVKDIEGGAEMIWNVTVELEGQSKPALVAEWIGRAYS